jgi:hypothetical protein
MTSRVFWTIPLLVAFAAPVVADWKPGDGYKIRLLATLLSWGASSSTGNSSAEKSD